jgi:ABC-type lipoprotein export system ATPase subunit
MVEMAWRNLWRNRRRTLLTLSSIGFGVFLAVLFTAMQDRNWSDMINVAARLGTGHVTLQHPEQLDAPSLANTVTGTDRLQELALAEPHVTHAVERVLGQTMLNTARESRGAGVVAFDPAVEDTTTLSVLGALVEGAVFDSDHDRGIILGARLARNLRVELGDKIVYTFTDKTGEIVSGLARVSGIVRTGAPSVDGGLCLLPIGVVREVLGYASDEATQIAVLLDDQRRTDDVTGRLDAKIGSDVRAYPWHEVQAELAAFIALKVGGARFMEALIAVLVAAGIFNTLLVSVMERMREFGILMAIGWSPRRLFSLVLLESAWLGILGLVAAILITALPYWYLATTGIDTTAILGQATTEISGVAMPSTFRVGIFAGHAVFIAVAAVVATLLAGLYPAWKAGRVDPVVHDVTKIYRQGAVDVHALRGLSLDIAKGEFAAICGPSGSGKTTVLNLIGALDRPTSGTVRLEGRDLSQLNRRELSDVRRDRIGFVFQAYNLIPVLTAYENAETVMWVQRIEASKRRRRVMELLAAVGLEGLEGRKPSELSGGQQQRVAIARAIAAQPAIVLADEPTANVDSETADTLIEIMERLNRDQRVTFLFSTHDPRVMERAHRLIRLVDGNVASDERRS